MKKEKEIEEFWYEMVSQHPCQSKRESGPLGMVWEGLKKGVRNTSPSAGQD